MRWRTWALAVVPLLVGACAGVVAGTTTSSSISPSIPTPSSTLPPVVECPGTGEFEEGGGIANVEGEDSDGSHLGRISWDTADLCETFLFVFETSEGAPATAVPDLSVGHLESFQVIRISLGITSTALTDQLVETALVDRLYVVRSSDGGMFVDLHLNAPAAARARVTSSPATLAIDLRPGFVEFTGASAIGGGIVVVSPSAQTSVDAQTEVVGYARGTSPGVITLATQDDQVVFETTTTMTGTDENWEEFSTPISLPPGEVLLFVGEESPEDGSRDGITLDLTVN